MGIFSSLEQKIDNKANESLAKTCDKIRDGKKSR
jgi:hypothetical protein